MKLIIEDNDIEDVRSELVTIGLDGTNELIQKFISNDASLKLELFEEDLCTETLHSALISFIDLRRKDGWLMMSWPLNGDTEQYTKEFCEKFSAAALKSGFSVDEDKLSLLLKS